MSNEYQVTGNSKKNPEKQIKESVTAKNETEARQIVESRYGAGQYDVKLTKGKLFG